MAVKASGANVNLRLRGTAGDGETDINEEINGESTDANANVSLATLSTGVGFDTTDGGHKMSEFFGYASLTPTGNFATVTYTGNNSTQSITSLNFKPDLVWIKGRNDVLSHVVHDVQNQPHLLITNGTNTLITNGSNTVTFTSNGFNLQGGPNHTSVNGSYNFVAWCWKAGGAAVSNTNGSITSQVSANPDAGFSIVSYTGNGSAQTIGHGLSSAPELIITKGLTTATNWNTYSATLGPTKYISLDVPVAQVNTNAKAFNNTAPTPSVFSVGSGFSYPSGIAYCFHSVNGYQKVGSYAGTGVNPGNFVQTDFEPRFLMVKGIDIADNWIIVDSARNASNPRNLNLKPNSSATEANEPGVSFEFSSTGFKSIGDGAGEGQANKANFTYIYLAIA